MSSSLRVHFRFVVLCVIVCALGLVGSAAAQTQDLNREVLGARLQTLFPGDEAPRTPAGTDPGEVAPLHAQIDGADTTMAPSAGDSQYGVVVYTQQPEALRRAGLQYNSRFPDFVTARLTRNEIAAASLVAGVESIRAAGAAEPHNDVAAGVSGVRALNNGRMNDTEYTGSGTLVCVIDSGIDYTHRDFRGIADDSQSRILFLWDQTLSADPDEDTPADRGDGDFSGFNYGPEYTRADIEDEIDGTPANEVRQEDTDGHGTHVAGTAAGNGGGAGGGLPAQKYKGMAPESDLIIVKAGNASFSLNNVVDGMNYCGEVAEDEGKPVVVNMSLGANFGPHDGTTFQDQAVDNFVSSTSGRAVVISAGNDGASGMHKTASISASSSAMFDISVPSVSSGEFRADIWMSTDDDAEISIETPGGTTVGPVTPGNATTVNTGEGQVFLSNQTDPNLGGGDRELNIDVDDDNGNPPAQGDWTVTLNNTSGNSLTYHTWLWDSVLEVGEAATLVEGDSEYTIATPGSSKNAITIGSWVHRWRWCSDGGSCPSYGGSDRSDDISSFSSIGPLRDGTQKPEIAAPGQGMASSYSDDMGPISSSLILPGGNHRLTQGTSMSSPATAGAVALLLQEESSLSFDQIKSTLENTAQTDGFTGSVPNDAWGYGKLDALRAMIRTVGPSSMPDANSRREELAYDEWGSNGALSVNGSQRIAVRFTPSFNGVVSSVLLHPYLSVNLTGPLNVEIWTDNGSGLPGQKLGSTVSWSEDRVSTFTWNALDVTDADVRVESGTDYHVVVSFANSGDDLDVLFDNGSVDGRSSTFDGSSWSAFGAGDFRLRPVVTTLNRRITIVGTDGTGDPDDVGWRLLSLPTAATRGDLEGDLDFNVDQGSLLYTWSGGSSSDWDPATSSSHPLSRGEGYILYFFDDSIDPITSDGRTLDAPNGSEDMSTASTVSGLTQSHQFHLLGNPFDETFDLSELKDPDGDLFTTDFQAAVLVWDPSGGGQWTTVTESGGSSDAIASGQGFFVERSSPGSGATSLTFNPAGKIGVGVSGDLIGSKAGGEEGKRKRALVDLDLTVTSEADTIASDGATVLFDEQAADGWDSYEASQLPPPQSSSYVTLNSPLLRSETLVRRLQASLPYPTTPDTMTVPLSAQSVQLSGTAHLRWPAGARSSNLDGWDVELEDTETGERVDLRRGGYDFALSLGDGSSLASPSEARFRLHVLPPSSIPVELTGFEATQKAGGVQLHWQTASETNNAAFHVQRGTWEGRAALSWNTIGTVEGAGTSSTPQTYQFTDQDLPFTVDSLAYRLRQVDEDGSVSTSKRVTVRRAVPNQLALEAPFPNPTNGRATLRLAVPEATDVRIAVYDLLGRRVSTVTDAEREAGRYEHRLDVGAWAAGTYFLRLSAAGETRTRKLTVVR